MQESTKNATVENQTRAKDVQSRHDNHMESQQSPGKTGSRKRRRDGFSMGLRISVSYVQMLADAFLACLILILIVFIAFHSVLLATNVNNIANDLNATEELHKGIYDIVVQPDIEVELATVSGETILNTFGHYVKPYERFPLWFFRRDRAVYIMLQTYLTRSEGIYRLCVFTNITPILMEMAVLFGFAVFWERAYYYPFLQRQFHSKDCASSIAEMTQNDEGNQSAESESPVECINAKDELKEWLSHHGMMDRLETAY